MTPLILNIENSYQYINTVHPYFIHLKSKAILIKCQVETDLFINS